MNNFMIGMDGKYNFQKFKRDFRKGFYGVQVCQFVDEAQIDILCREAEQNSFKIGIHFPLRSGIARFRDPQFFSLDKAVRKKAYEYMEEEFRYIENKQINPAYVLIHYPKPVIIKEAFDMTNWRFADKSEYVYEKDYSFDRFKSDSEALFKWLSEKSIQYKFTPVLEFDALNKYVQQDNFLENLLDKYQSIKICLDTGRLHLQHKIDNEFDEINIIKRFAKYTKVIHLWNVKVNGNLENSHFPALPSLKVEEGWGPIEEYMKIIKQECSNALIMFEHKSEIITEEELNQCYSWINDLLTNRFQY
ncbi:sugar phosphate isomerase/epimerase [Clostridium sp. 19966]|uniref:sugar phosphate isomerase/epimerase n=1 Tax=Clostridium sp. 19966 TaxID=2768166 RepID=UPI0028DF3C84|nr:sugar phosphate isomerase/epimerase [Clostridium sp. 19966]MDT8715995.1 sugar phosphate isomerase/epimerase [Clostridium sp. 19966]